MSIYDDAPTVRTGTWLYDGHIEVQVKIVRLEFTPGSGDALDPPEMADDRNEPSYVVVWSSPVEHGKFGSASTCHPSLLDAQNDAERLTLGIRWA